MSSLSRQILLQVHTSVFGRVDLVSELLGLALCRPLNVRGYKRHVLIVWSSVRVEDSDPLADVLERVGIQRRIAGRQGGAIETVFLVFCQPARVVSG